jgi:acyl-CoA thioester hydrolase
MSDAAALLARYGAEGRWTLVREHEVRWSECDLYGHVNHAAYLTLFEDLRVDHWRGLTGGRPLSPDAPGPVVAQIEVRYVKPAGFLDRVLLTARTVALRRSSYTHEYALWKGGLVCSARCVCVVLRNDTGAKVAIPPDIRRAMIEGEGAVEEGAG